MRGIGAKSNVNISNPSGSADIQDPLPESNWVWRRVYIFLVTTFFCFLLYIYTDRISAVAVLRPSIGVPALTKIIIWLIWTIMLMATYYLVAPSAEQITKMIQTARSLREGVVFHSAARVTSHKADAESESTTGQPTATPPAAPAHPAPAKLPATEILE